MELLSFSTPSSYYPSSSNKLCHFLPTKLLQSLSLRPSPPPQLCTKSSLSSSAQNLGPNFQRKIVCSASSPQTPESAMKGAESDAMGLLLRERIVFIGGEIDDFVADYVTNQLLLLDAWDPTKDIRLFINSSGGSLSSSLAIYDVLQLVRAEVSTIALGLSASTAAIILAGGAKGKRLAMPNARIMIHQPLGGIKGKVLLVEVQARELQENKKNVIKIYSERTGRSLEQVEKDIDRDKYMSPIEAVDFGIIDEIIDRDTMIPVVPLKENVVSSRAREMLEDRKNYLHPDVPDDEIY